MIYKLLLSSGQDILVPHDQFKRKRISRSPKDDVSFTWTCRMCGMSVNQRSRVNIHMYRDCRQEDSNNSWILTSVEWSEHKGPGFSLALLRTCRLVHSEAVPILYRQNTLRFQTAAALSAFRWFTDTEQAGFVRKIHIVLPQGRTKHVVRSGENFSDLWLRYMARADFGLAKEFPNLRGVTLTLGRGLATATAKTIKGHLDMFMKYMYRLGWIQLLGLNDVELIYHLKPILEKNDESKSDKALQVQTSKYDKCIGWTNASIWWNLPGSKPPCEIPAFVGDRSQRWSLYRYPDGHEVTYTAGCSFGRQLFMTG